jgi:hypothetical protein
MKFFVVVGLRGEVNREETYRLVKAFKISAGNGSKILPGFHYGAVGSTRIRVLPC